MTKGPCHCTQISKVHRWIRIVLGPIWSNADLKKNKKPDIQDERSNCGSTFTIHFLLSMITVIVIKGHFTSNLLTIGLFSLDPSPDGLFCFMCDETDLSLTVQKEIAY